MVDANPSTTDTDDVFDIVYRQAHVAITADADTFRIPRVYQKGIIFWSLYRLYRKDTRFKNTAKSDVALSFYKSTVKKMIEALQIPTMRLVIKGATPRGRQRNQRHAQLPADYPAN